MPVTTNKTKYPSSPSSTINSDMRLQNITSKITHKLFDSPEKGKVVRSSDRSKIIGLIEKIRSFHMKKIQTYACL